MAICDTLPGVEVTIDGADGPLKEYNDTDTEPNEGEVIRYIESQTDQDFKITMTIKEGAKLLGDCLTLASNVDGHDSDGFTLANHRWGAKDPSASSSGFEVGGGRVRKFKFGEVKTIEGEVKDGEKKKAEEIGTIKVVVWHMTSTLASTQTAVERTVKETEAVAEKALKGLAVSHNVAYGEEVVVDESNRTYWDATPVAGVDGPAATFMFKYRSQESLKSMLIIPRTPEPTPLEDRPVEELTDEELRELVRRSRAAGRSDQETIARVKRERSDDEEGRRKKARPSQGDTVLELCEDGGFKETSTEGLPPKQRVVIDLE